ncbi:MAG TPA: hypothetical protein V6C89_05030 [Drouetiella sp.]|jgi:hypothetical protein
MLRTVSLLALLFCMTAAHADESFRIPRPEASPNSAPTESRRSERLLGDLIYAGMRTPMSKSLFERWRQNYCSPYVCNMVLCHSTCAEFAEHCPSFSESGRVIRLDSRTCLSPDWSSDQSSNQSPVKPSDGQPANQRAGVDYAAGSCCK